MKYFLDTNICIYALKDIYPAIRHRLLKLTPDDVKIASIVKAELLLGALKSRRPEETQAILEQFLLPFEIIPFDDAAAIRYAHVRCALERIGKLAGPNDLLLAATTLAAEGVLVTHNRKEFTPIPGLQIEDWAAE